MQEYDAKSDFRKIQSNGSKQLQDAVLLLTAAANFFGNRIDFGINQMGFVKKSFPVFFLLLSTFGFSQVVINEVHVSPDTSTNVQTQSLAYCPDATFGAEWIEIYNASKCDTIDLSCYMLGSNTADSNFGTFSFPANTRINPLSFIVVGGKNAPGVDFALPDYCASVTFCSIGQWFLNDDYGWIALYKPDGSVADALFWTANAGEVGQLVSNPVYSEVPCTPSSCAIVGTLKAASQMTPGTEIFYAGKGSGFGLSLYRQIDGGAPWLTDGAPTPAQCNGACAPPTDLAIQISSYADETCLLENGWAQVFVSGGTLPYDLDWSNTANGDSIFNLVAGTYSVTVTDDADCIKATTVTLVNIGAPDSVSVIPIDPVIFKGESVQLSLLTAAIIDSMVWTPAPGLSCDNCPSPIANPTTITTYNVVVTDSDGCIGTSSVVVQVLSDENSTFIPTAFTPNADNLNDILFVRSPKLIALELHIFDRWGNEVFATNDLNTGWDGKDKKGNEVDVGIYVYYAIVIFDNGKSKTLQGNVGVIR